MIKKAQKPTKTGNPAHRPKKPIVTPKKLQKALLDNEMNAAGAARDLGVATRTVSAHLERKPEILERVESERDRALKAAGINRQKVYTRIYEGLDATKPIGAQILVNKDGELISADAEGMIEVTDFKERRESAKLCATLIGDLKDDTQGQGGVVVNMPVIIVNSNQLKFEVGSNE